MNGKCFSFWTIPYLQVDLSLVPGPDAGVTRHEKVPQYRYPGSAQYG